MRKLLREGCAVAVAVRATSDLRRIEDVVPQLTVIRTNLLAFDDDARCALRAFAPEIVFHLAWHGVSRDQRDSPEQIHVNLPLSLSVFREAEAAGARTWVGLGSVSEYGSASVPLVESMEPRPVSSYGVAKLAAGVTTRTLCELAKMRFVWVRLFLAYGPADDEHRLIPTVIRALVSGETPSLTRGDQLVDFLHGDDAADALWAVAINENAEGVFNLASGETCTVRALAELIRDLVAPSASLGFGRVDHRSPDFHGADVSRLRAVTGWSPRVPLRDGLLETAAWCARHAVPARGDRAE